jgi:hypothetical protein
MDLAQAIVATARQLGIDPLDLATVVSYETAGTLDPWQKGPITQYGQHRGLIQWGEPQARKYGVYKGMPVDQQMAAAGRYLVDAGVRPGMGLMDIYSAVNAGRVGRYGASDANNGGAPGTVADKVNNQMAGHRAKGAALLGGTGGAYRSAMGAPAPAAPPPQPGLSSPMVPLTPPAEPVTQTPPANTGLGAMIASLGSAIGGAAGGAGAGFEQTAAPMRESGPLAGSQMANQGVMDMRELQGQLMPVVDEVATGVEPMKLAQMFPQGPASPGPFSTFQPMRSRPRPAPLMGGGISLRA